MSEFLARHLVLVRHGQSEGDVRRSMLNQPSSQMLDKHPRDEEQTSTGAKECQIAGKWIAKYVLQEYGLGTFDEYKVSPLIRTIQSADSLRINKDWQKEDRLTERDRGYIQGMTRKQHAQEYPESYNKMLEHPFHWTPPGGESLLRVAMRFGELVDDFFQSSNQSALFVTHRDVLWSSRVPMDRVPLDKIELQDTDLIHNGHVVHYTNVSPLSKRAESTSLIWKRSCTPWMDSSGRIVPEWSKLTN